MIALAFLPNLVVGEEENTAAAVNFQPICDFNANEIKRLKKNKEELEVMVQLGSDLYKKLYNSSSICGTIGYLTLPDCAKKEGVKERMNVFDKLDDNCAEEKTNIITKSLKKVLNLVTVPSGQDVFRSCKDIVVKNILEQFEKMQGLICSLCDKSTCVSSRRKRSYGGGYYPGGYDPSTIWFQYLLCHEQKISCYFFTQGWNEKEFGQYYLYENLLDTGFDKLGHASSGTDDLLTLALLGGLGGSHQYSHHAYQSYKKRREIDDKNVENVPISGGDRRRRSGNGNTDKSTEDTEGKVTGGGRRRRSDDADKSEGKVTSGGRRRRSDDAAKSTKDTEGNVTGGDRRRRSGNGIADKSTEDTEGKVTGGGRRRRSDDAAKSKGKVTSGDRRRRSDDAAKSEGKVTGGGRRRRSGTGNTDKSIKDTEGQGTGGGRRRRNADTDIVPCQSADDSC